jgi:hypothetical protein
MQYVDNGRRTCALKFRGPAIGISARNGDGGRAGLRRRSSRRPAASSRRCIGDAYTHTQSVAARAAAALDRGDAGAWVGDRSGHWRIATSVGCAW